MLTKHLLVNKNTKEIVVVLGNCFCMKEREWKIKINFWGKYLTAALNAIRSGDLSSPMSGKH